MYLESVIDKYEDYYEQPPRYFHGALSWFQAVSHHYLSVDGGFRPSVVVRVVRTFLDKNTNKLFSQKILENLRIS